MVGRLVRDLPVQTSWTPRLSQREVSTALDESTLLVLCGVVTGTAIAALLTRFIEKFLYGITRTDPAMTALAATLLIGVALVAAGIPALRAARVQPTNALRHE